MATRKTKSTDEPQEGNFTDEQLRKFTLSDMVRLARITGAKLYFEAGPIKFSVDADGNSTTG